MSLLSITRATFYIRHAELMATSVAIVQVRLVATKGLDVLSSVDDCVDVVSIHLVSAPTNQLVGHVPLQGDVTVLLKLTLTQSRYLLRYHSDVTTKR